MRTRLTIMAIVLAAVTAAIGTIVMLTLLLGWLGLAIGLLGALAVLVAYRLFVQPWQHPEIRLPAHERPTGARRAADAGLDTCPETAEGVLVGERDSPQQAWGDGAVLLRCSGSARLADRSSPCRSAQNHMERLASYAE
jgi:hypothetical protein